MNAPVETPVEYDLNDPALYLNRELTWLAFNERVLHEAEDARTPLLERVKFIAIVSANLDEFFMKRVGGLKQQLGAGVTRRTVDGRTPAQQIAECYAKVREMELRKAAIWEELVGLLAEQQIGILPYDSLDSERKAAVDDLYYRNIYPLVTPQSIDPAHPFPFISNLSLNLLVSANEGDERRNLLTRVKVPVGTGISRLLKVPGEGDWFVALEEVIAANLHRLLPGIDITACNRFRVTRNANTEGNEEQAEDLLSLIELEVRERRFAPIVRLEVGTRMDPILRGMLAAELGLDETADVFEFQTLPQQRDLFELAAVDRPDLHDTPFTPLEHPELRADQNIFHLIRNRGSLLLAHPYDSFITSVERFLREAATDPKVRAIKMTLYRTSGESKVVDYLMHAAENGKQVAVVVELKARFDEAANIRWASRLEQAGVHVTFGVVGLKTHSKVILVVRQDYSGIRRYLHIGTGNYNASTARMYSDFGLFTVDAQIGEDATELFNYLTTGYTPQRHYHKLLPSPKHLKRALMERIVRERKLHCTENPGLIQFKMNALEDVDITRALYEAARDGVRVELIIRDTCRLRPGIPGLSENVRVVSIVGRFLEHARIYYFRNGGDEEYLIGSADSMKRNLESRVEVVTPVEDVDARMQLRQTLDMQLADHRSAWEMDSEGNYTQLRPEVPEALGCQEKLIAWHKARYLASRRDRRYGKRGRRRNLR